MVIQPLGYRRNYTYNQVVAKHLVIIRTGARGRSLVQGVSPGTVPEDSKNSLAMPTTYETWGIENTQLYRVYVGRNYKIAPLKGKAGATIAGILT